MPKGIVTENKDLETCPEPEFNLSSKDVEQFVEELGITPSCLSQPFGVGSNGNVGRPI